MTIEKKYDLGLTGLLMSTGSGVFLVFPHR